VLKEKTLDQILDVLNLTAKYHSTGLPAQKAYQRSVKDVAHKYSVRYQTIADGCRRRLNLDNVNEFMALLDEWLGGQPRRLKELLVKNIGQLDEYKVENFFDQNIQVPVPSTTQDQRKVEEGFEALTFKIPRNIASQFRVLAEAEGKTIQDLASSVFKKYVDEHHFAYVKNLINSLPLVDRELIIATLVNDLKTK